MKSGVLDLGHMQDGRPGLDTTGIGYVQDTILETSSSGGHSLSIPVKSENCAREGMYRGQGAEQSLWVPTIKTV